MSSTENRLPLAPEIRTALAGVRRGIRTYVLLETIAWTAIWIGATFWTALALDYLPVLVGASELPRAVRAVLLLAMVGGAGFLIYWYALRRLYVPMADRSMAVLLERRYREFGDSLLTTVELAEVRATEVGFNDQMFQQTAQQATGRIPKVQIGGLFNWRPLAWRLLAGTTLVLSLVVFAVLNSPVFAQAAQRLWLLGDEPWPRRSMIQVVGIEVQRPEGLAAEQDAPTLVEFDQQAVKVARGASFNLRVVADASASVVPEICTIRYRTADGDRGRVRMKKIGRVRTEPFQGGTRTVQWFAFDGKPFKGVLSNVVFDVVGNDHRVGDYTVQVVESPTVVEAKLDCIYPEYLVDEKAGTGLPRTLDYLPSGTQLPRGSRVVIRGKVNKDLQRAVIRNADTKEETVIEVTGSDELARTFEYPVPQLMSNLSLEVALLDRDQVYSDKPFRIALAAVADEAPRVESRLQGIGTAVTPDVLVPARGKLTDDYEVAKAWVEVQIGELDVQQLPFTPGREGTIETELDFRDLRSDPRKIELKPQDKLRLRIAAQDKFKLGEEGPNQGGGELYELDVVPPEELLRMLESRELGLRRRYEQILEEMTELRDSLLRVKVELASGDERPATPPKPAGEGDGADEGLSPEQRARSLRILRVQRATQQSQKSSQEVLGVALSFAEIREELINNRVDTEDRKDRLQEQIATPLQQIVAQGFPELERRLALLEQTLDNPAQSPSNSAAAVEQAELVLTQLNDVLQKMLDLETYNELLDIVRDLIKDQGDLLEKTRQQKKKQLLELTE
ncbi:MAG: hypothetical protein U0939_14035 [Pirellulales bacterium]